MPLPSPPHSPPPSSRKPSWFSLSRWFGAAAVPPAAARGRTAVGAEADVEQLRTQARRRLIGAVVLLAAGVVAFPLVFETEPRPMGVDTPMQRVQGTVTGAAVPSLPPQQRSAVEDEPITPTAAPSVEAASPAAEPPSTPEVAPIATATAPAAAPLPPAATPAPVNEPSAAEREQARSAEAQRARALLEGRSAAVPSAPAAPTEPVVAARYVVQVGAFTEKRALSEARSRVERLGLKTYTQVIESPAGPRTRVRVGPFDSRAEADAAGARLRAAGLPAAILTL